MGQIIQRITYYPYREEVAIKTLQTILTSIEPKYQRTASHDLQKLTRYVHAHRFNDNVATYDTTKAIAFMGPTGTGKTLLFRALSEYMKIDEVKFLRNGKIAQFGFGVISSRGLVSKFGSGGFDTMETYLNKPVLCIDDVGAENVGIHYGSRLDIFEHFIEERYMSGRVTHFSTNLPESELREKYGERVYSRIMETTQFIEVTGKDWRV